MSVNTTRAVTLVTLIGVLAMQASPALAQFTGGGTAATNWVVALLTPVIPLACVVVGGLAWTGRVNWAWFVGALAGTVLFFGRDQVVSMFRSWFGV